MSLSTPVIFLIFRRPDLTSRVFETIRQAQPKKLLVVADGPRNESEVMLCQQARAVTEQIDWDCEVLRNYADTNLGCRNRVSSGLNWAFEQVEEAIVLEDDCLPHPSFFRYCQTLLDYYRNDERIMVVSGNNFQDGQKRTLHSYYFSKYNHCWGWATWRRAWRHWEFAPEKWPEIRDLGLINAACDTPNEEKYWTAIFDSLFFEGNPDTWDYSWLLACWLQNGLTVLPNTNLVSNIGCRSDGTNIKGDSPLANLAVGDIGNILHPSFVYRCKAADEYTFRHTFNGLAMEEAEHWKSRFLTKVALVKQTAKGISKISMQGFRL